MKKPREQKTEVDLTVLQDPAQLMGNGTDCFGNEWDPTDKDCAICHDVEICGIVYQEKIKGKKRKAESEKGPFLDQTAFENVPVDKIVKSVRQWAEDDDPATYEELEEQIMDSAKTKDKVAVREFIKIMCSRENLIITEEKTIVPNEGTDNHIIARSPLITEDSYPSS